jgi:cytochrome c556
LDSSPVKLLLVAFGLIGTFAVSGGNAGGAPASAQTHAVAAAVPAPNSAEAEGLIFERQQLMDQLKRDSETLGDIVAGIAPADKLPAVTRSIAQAARDSVAIFGQPVPGGRAKPEVWTNHAEFIARMEAFSRNADAMAHAGQTGNVDAVTGLLIDALPCKQCHDLYREPPKPG